MLEMQLQMCTSFVFKEKLALQKNEEERELMMFLLPFFLFHSLASINIQQNLKSRGLQHRSRMRLWQPHLRQRPSNADRMVWE